MDIRVQSGKQTLFNLLIEKMLQEPSEGTVTLDCIVPVVKGSSCKSFPPGLKCSLSKYLSFQRDIICV